MLASTPGTPDVVTLVGSDDGNRFWSVQGRFTDLAAGDRALTIDFSPLGERALTCRLAAGRLVFDDGSSWARLSKPPPLRPSGAASGGSLGGVYTDPKHSVPGTFRGVRLVQTARDGSGSGAAFAVTGTDDGVSWWSVRGHTMSDRAASAVSIDFSPKGGPSTALATFAAETGTLRFADGNGWTRVVADSVPSSSTLEGSF